MDSSVISTFRLFLSRKTHSLIYELRSLERLSEYVRVHLFRPFVHYGRFPRSNPLSNPEVPNRDVPGALCARATSFDQRHARGVVLVDSDRLHLVALRDKEIADVEPLVR